LLIPKGSGGSKLQIRKVIFPVVFILALAAATSVYASEPTEPHDANAMWIEPSTIDISGVSVGYKFNVTVWANSSLQTKGWQIRLFYPKDYINATRAGYTNGSKSEFFKDINTMPLNPSFKPDYNATHNRLDYGEAWMSGPYRSPGYGSLCWIEFEVVALPGGDTPIQIPLDIKYAFEALSPPQTYLLYSDGSKTPLDVYNAVVVPELNMLAMLALLGLATPMVLYAYKKKR
jgi:hypothetical protein